MVRQRRSSAASDDSGHTARDQVRPLPPSPLEPTNRPRRSWEACTITSRRSFSSAPAAVGSAFTPLPLSPPLSRNQIANPPLRSCLLHRFIKNEWRFLSSQTIGVEFASKIIRIGTDSRMKRIKLQLWDTAGTERFRSVSRSYYRGAAGAILVYDITSAATFAALPPFLADARALA